MPDRLETHWWGIIDRLAQVEAGEVASPETAEALIAMLPEITWPEPED